MPQPDSACPDSTYLDRSAPPPVSSAAIGRLAAAGGFGFLVASLAGDLVIGALPGPGTPAAQLVPYYAVHHAQVLTGGMLLALGGVFFVLFGLALWARIRAGVRQPAAGRTGHRRHHPGRADHPGQRGQLRRARRHRRPARRYPSRPAGLAHHGLGRLAGRQRQHLPVPAHRGGGRPAGPVRAPLAGLVRRCCSPYLTLVPGQFGFLASLAFYVWAAAAGIWLLFARQPRLARHLRPPFRKEARHA